MIIIINCPYKISDLSKAKYINRRKSMTKTQKNKILKHLDKIKNGEKALFTIDENDVYYTVDGIEGYNFPLETLKEIMPELPESKDSNTIKDIFANMEIYGRPVRTNIKSVLSEMNEYRKTFTEKAGKIKTIPYTFNIRGINHTYNLKRLINALELLGNDTKIYVGDTERSVMMFISDIGGMVLMPNVYKEAIPKVNLTLD